MCPRNAVHVHLAGSLQCSATERNIVLNHFEIFLLLHEVHTVFQLALGKVEKNLPSSYEIHLILENSEDFG